MVDARQRRRTGRGALVVSAAALWAALAAPPAARAQEVAAERRVLTLEEAVSMALRENRELEGSRLVLEEAEQRVREAWGSVFPSMNLTGSYTRNLSVPVLFFPTDPSKPDELTAIRVGTDNAWNMQVRGEQALFQPAVFVGVGAAGRYRALQGEAVRGTAQQVVTRTRLTFFNVLLAQEALRLSDNSVRRVRQVLEETRALERSGLSSEYDVLRLEVELANLEPNLRRAQNEVAAARRQLAVELGLDGLDGVEVEGSLAALNDGGIAGAGESRAALRYSGPIDLESMTAEDLVELARRNRSDLRQLELTERLRRTEVRLEQMEYLPKISLVGLYSINAQENGDPNFFGETAQQRAYGKQLGVQVSLPLFSGFQRPARIAQKQATLRQVQTQREQATAHAVNQVRTLLEQVLEAKQRTAAQGLAVRQAERGFQIATAKYREGTGSQLEVTDAEVALRQSEFNYAEAMYDYLVARARLDEAAGVVPMVDTGDGLALER